MRLVYDLHTHSTASDGTLTPAELVSHAAGAGVETLALTDHDTTSGIEEARQAASLLHELSLVPGIELSVTWNRQTVHIVGLGIDPNDNHLQQGLVRIMEFRQWRAEEIGRRLSLVGIEDAYRHAKALSNGRLISRTHFGRYLVKIGKAKDMRDVFRHYLVAGKPGHVAGEWATLEEAIGWIHHAGGQAVIAHPARYRMTRTKLRKLIGQFRECGGEAIEVVSGSHSKDDMFTMARHAADFDLLASAGSDFHSPEHTWNSMGRLPQIPHGIPPVWSTWN
ncbi:MAG: PHP domain-containing protein [Sedimenticolaceae bacterium]|nr:PHP domain-containing protein [Sedimenticolaceae bacterium]